MGFAQLPSSPGFQPPVAPDWSPFALEAIRERERRPILNTAAMVDQATNQINNILQMQSPLARAERMLQMQQIQGQMQTWQDYRQHPENFVMTAHGPIARDPVERALKLSQANKNIQSANFLANKSGAVSGNQAFLQNARQKFNDLFQAHDNGTINLPTAKAPAVEAAPTQQSADATDNTADNVANMPAEGEGDTTPSVDYGSSLSDVTPP
jgi:hypothetical protein